MMFALPAILCQSRVNSNLLLTFHDGSIIDSVTPARIFTLDANAYVGYPCNHGSKFANTSLVFRSNSSTTLGCYTTDVSGLNVGAAGLDYTIEFWYSGFISSNGPTIALVTTGSSTNPFVFSPFGNGSIGVNFHNISMPISNARRGFWNHYAYVREGNSVRSYFNGVLAYNTGIFTQLNIPIVGIYLGRVYATTASNLRIIEGNINYFAITLNAKYNANFNPNTDTGFTNLFFYPENNTGYCV